MTNPCTCREATRDDLPGVLALYGQPDLDSEHALALPQAEKILEAAGARR